ncbi:efflux ABC transporter, permease protein [Clostridiales bacterium KA00134]|nr:efflux ABC transporter, permease protein [Clostridiales bacterium KA00134]
MKRRLENINLIREIRGSFSRFISILMIVGLGVFVFVGLLVTGPVMRHTLNEAIDKSKMEDIEIICSMGFRDEDIEKIKSQTGLEDYEILYDIDTTEKDNGSVFKLICLPKKMGLPIVTEGRLPSNPGEIILDESAENEGFKLGDTISFSKEVDKFNLEKIKKDKLKTYTFKIVGLCDSTNYIANYYRGVSQRGLGQIKHYGYIPAKSFEDKTYTIAKIRYKDTKGLLTTSKKYKQKLSSHLDDLTLDFKYDPERRLKENRDKIEKSLADGKEQINKARLELDDAKNKILTGKDKLKSGEKAYTSGKKTYDQKIYDAEKELANSKTDLDKGSDKLEKSEGQLQEGKASLLEGKKKLDQAKALLDENSLKYQNGMQDYKEGKGKLEASEDFLIKSKRQLDEALAKLLEAKTKLEENKSKLDSGKAQLDEGQRAFEENQAKIDRAFAEAKTQLVQYGLAKEDDSIDQALGKINGIKEALDKLPAQGLEFGSEIDKQIKDLEAEIERLDPVNDSDKIASLNIQLASLKMLKKEIDGIKEKYPQINLANLKAVKEQIAAAESGLEQLSSGQKALDQAKIELEKNQAKYEAGLSAYNEGLKTLDESERQYQEGLEKYQKGYEEYLKGLKKLQDAKEELDAGKTKLDQGKLDYKKGLLDYEKNKAKLDSAQIDLEKGKAKLQAGKNSYDAGLKRFQDEKIKGQASLDKSKAKLQKARFDIEEAEKKFQTESKKAEEKIRDGQKDLDHTRDILQILEKPQYEIISRNKNFSVDQYIDYSKRVDLLSGIFPIFFFAIAMLVSFTTMKRMVEEERIEIGTHKALGYSPAYIARKYFAYGSLAATIGGSIGALIGHTSLARLIGNAYSTSTIFQDKLIFKFYPQWVILAMALGIGFTGVTALLTVYSSLREKTATLLRGKPPKNGTRIFLEKIGPLWKRMNFFKKVTARNLFRYKGRMIMTIVGIMGCVALLVLGFGLKGSVRGVSEKQFFEIFKYQASVIYNKNLDRESFIAYTKTLNENKQIKSYREYLQKSLSFDYKDRHQEVSLIVPGDKDTMKEDIFLRKRGHKENLDLPDKKAIISEKMANLMRVKKGDKIQVKDDFGTSYDIRVGEICENYVGHYIYMDKDYYQKVFGQEFRSNMDLISFNTNDAKMQDKIKAELLDYKSVLAVTDLTLAQNAMGQFEFSISLVELVISISSSLLALIVLYNLTNINIEERRREISTIKVLGFYTDEAVKYIYRETWTLTFMGMVLGLIMGKVLHYLVVSVVTPPNAMLSPTLLLRSYFIALAITVVITFLTRLIFYKKIKNTNMVEALKAVE